MLRRMERQIAQRIDEAIKAIALDPRGHHLDVKRLTDRPGFRLRIGGWRVIFDMDAETLEVLDIGPRGDVFKRHGRR